MIFFSVKICGKFYAGDNGYSQFFSGCFRLRYSADILVIGQRNRLQAPILAFLHHLGWSKAAIGIVRM